MKVVGRVGRRHFLLGASSALAIPFLPSLLGREARAQTNAPPKRFVAYRMDHCGIAPWNLVPPDDHADETHRLGSFDVHRGPLRATTEGGRTAISPILTADSGALTPALIAKLNVMRGLVWTASAGHNVSSWLGNYAQRFGEPSNPNWRPTIDQVLAHSDTFYPMVPRERSLSFGLEASFDHEVPGDFSTPVQALPSTMQPLEAFRRIYVRVESEGPPTPSRTPVIDRVLGNYRSLRSGAFGDAARLSRLDRDRLDAHIAHLADLEDRLTTIPSLAASAACQSAVEPPMLPGYDDDWDLTALVDRYQMINSVIATAFACGSTGVAMLASPHPFATRRTSGDWHQEAAHLGSVHGSGPVAEGTTDFVVPTTRTGNGPSHLGVNAFAQAELRDASQAFFERVYLDLLRKLDAIEEADGATCLDHSIAMFTYESSFQTHDDVDIPVILAGGAGGALNTGYFLDYRDRNRWAEGIGPWALGLHHRQLMNSVLQAMGLSREEYEREGEAGYGMTQNSAYYGSLPDDLWAYGGDVLPFLFR